jgi:antitoxin VapB
MTNTAKLFMADGCQAVRLPDEFRFEGSEEVLIHRDPQTGDVILSSRTDSWDDFFALYETTDIPADFMCDADRDLSICDRDPFAGWKE